MVQGISHHVKANTSQERHFGLQTYTDSLNYPKFVPTYHGLNSIRRIPTTWRTEACGLIRNKTRHRFVCGRAPTKRWGAVFHMLNFFTLRHDHYLCKVTAMEVLQMRTKTRTVPWTIVMLGAIGLVSASCGDTNLDDPLIHEEPSEFDLEETNAAIFAGTSACKITAFKADGCYPEKKWLTFAQGKCSANAMALTKLAPIGVCDGGFSGIEFVCCPNNTDPSSPDNSDADAPPLPPKPKPTPDCSVHAAGGPNVCNSEDTWKKKAKNACAEKGLTLGKIKLGGECKGGFGYAKFTCCGDPQIPPPVPQEECTEHKVDINTCKNDDAWKELLTKTCLEKGQYLVKFEPLAKCAGGGFSGAAFVCCGADLIPPPPPPPPPPGDCVEQKVALDACKNEGELKEIAYKECLQLGLSLADLNVYGPCSSGGFSIMAWTCCGDSVPPQPEPTNQCFEGKLGEATSCKPAEVWKEYASNACLQSNATLAKVEVAGPCSNTGGYQMVYYVCCAPNEPTDPPPPPPAPECYESKMGGPTSCKSESTWLEYAANECSADGYGLAKFGFDESCGPGLYRYVYFACCIDADTTQPPPPPPPKCFTSSLGDPTSCKPASTWKEYAWQTCESEGFLLTELGLDKTCGADNYSYAKFTCCAP